MSTEIKDLIGKKLRVLGPGDVGTADYDENRVTVHIDEDDKITDLGIG